MRVSQVGRSRQVSLVTQSPLVRVDPRTKLFISLAVSVAVMLPFERLLIFVGIYALFLVCARLLPPTINQVWRLKWILLGLFFLDWWLIDLNHAATICTRLILLTGVFTLFFFTTTTRQMGLALEHLRVPYRYAFSLSLAFQSVGLLEDEWRAIREAQRSRGAYQELSSFKKVFSQFGDLISLTVPAIVLTTKRAWTITESAYARGFDSPNRKSYLSLSFTWVDALLATVTVIIIVLLYWRW